MNNLHLSRSPDYRSSKDLTPQNSRYSFYKPLATVQTEFGVISPLNSMQLYNSSINNRLQYSQKQAYGYPNTDDTVKYGGLYGSVNHGRISDGRSAHLPLIYQNDKEIESRITGSRSEASVRYQDSIDLFKMKEMSGSNGNSTMNSAFGSNPLSTNSSSFSQIYNAAYKLLSYSSLDASEEIERRAIPRNELEKAIPKQQPSDYSNEKKPIIDEGKKKQTSPSFNEEKALHVKRKAYDPKFGFVISCDQITGLPATLRFCQILHSVHVGEETVVSPQMAIFSSCKRCPCNKKSFVYNVVATAEAALVLQIEDHFSESRNANNGIEVIGWTMVDLFDVKGRLKREKWQLPIFEKPRSTAVTIDQIPHLRRKKNLWLYLRILLPNDESALPRTKKSIDPDEYTIPEIYTRFEYDMDE